MQRNIGIDLLKILSMIGVVVLHICGAGGVVSSARAHDSVCAAAVELLKCAAIPAVNCFILCSGFTMVGRAYKWRRLFELWLEVVFYGLMILVIASVLDPKTYMKGRYLLRSILPVTSDSYWFFTQYVVLCFCVPILNIVYWVADKITHDMSYYST